MELNKIYNMDCMEGMKEIPDKYFELAIVDPPYGQFNDDKRGHQGEDSAIMSKWRDTAGRPTTRLCID